MTGHVQLMMLSQLGRYLAPCVWQESYMHLDESPVNMQTTDESVFRQERLLLYNAEGEPRIWLFAEFLYLNTILVLQLYFL